MCKSSPPLFGSSSQGLISIGGSCGVDGASIAKTMAIQMNTPGKITWNIHIHDIFNNLYMKIFSFPMKNVSFVTLIYFISMQIDWMFQKFVHASKSSCTKSNNSLI